MPSRTLIPAAAVAAAAVALLAGGCGGGSSTSAAGAAQTGLPAYSRCMRSHGLLAFPDPISGQGIPKDEIPVGNPRFSLASQACQHLMPASGLGPADAAPPTRTRLANILSFARCMRGHGVIHFPDPTAQGELSIEMVQAQGIDVRSPAVLRTVRSCLPASHGALTPAQVRDALSHAGG